MPQDLAEPTRLERMARPVPRWLLPFIVHLPWVLVCGLITAFTMYLRHAGWIS